MNKELLKKTFREYKKASGVKYAITNPDGLGDCMSCVNYALCEKYGEDSKVAIRNIRRDAMEAFKGQKKRSEITEDDLKNVEKDMQKLTDDYIKNIEKLVEAKEKELYEI
jgi:hypothetical protein